MACRQLAGTANAEQQDVRTLAADAGYDLTVDYRDYHRHCDGRGVRSHLDFGIGATAGSSVSRRTADPVITWRWYFRFVLATRNISPFRTSRPQGQDLGGAARGDPYNVLSQMLRYELGIRSEGVQHTVVNTPTQRARRSRRAHAAMLIIRLLKANSEIGTSHHEFLRLYEATTRPAGEGAGMLLAVGQKIRVLPRRLYLTGRSGSAAERHQERSGARHRSCSRSRMPCQLSATKPGEVSDLAKKYWSFRPNSAARCRGHVLSSAAVLAHRRRRRGAARNVEVHGGRQADPEPLAWSQVKAGSKCSSLVKALRQERASPMQPDFKDSKAQDLAARPRGHASWQAT